MVILQELDHGTDPVDHLQAYGISEANVNKLKDAGLCNIESVVISPREYLLQIKGLGEALVDKIIDAAFTLMTSTDNTSQPDAQGHEIIQINSGSSEQQAILEGAMETRSITEVYGEFPSGKLCQPPSNPRGGQEKALCTDAEGTFLHVLPIVLWSHILLLANLPLKTMVNLSTNKTLKMAITSDWFASNFERTGSGNGLELIVQGPRVWEFCLYRVENNAWRYIDVPREEMKSLNIRIVGACRGLVLIMIPLNFSNLYLWNISLRRVRDLPLPLPTGLGEKKADVMGFGVGYRAAVLRTYAFSVGKMHQTRFKYTT